MLLAHGPAASSVACASRAAPSLPRPSSRKRGSCRCGATVPPENRSGFVCATISNHLKRWGDNSPSLAAAVLLPVAAACTVLTACPPPVEAGFLSGVPGLESFEFPSLPTPDVMKKMREENVARAKELDSTFKKSPLLQQLLKKSKENKEMHKKEIEDKYCERGAEWGVGDCSLVGLPKADRDAFFETLKKGKAATAE